MVWFLLCLLLPEYDSDVHQCSCSGFLLVFVEFCSVVRNMNVLLGCVFRSLYLEGVYMTVSFSYRILMIWFFLLPACEYAIYCFQYFSSGSLTWNKSFHQVLGMH